MSSSSGRLAFIDALKAVASQLIVLHHLAFYGPMSDHAQALAPGFLFWLSQYGRISVQVFLVIGGFLAAQALTRNDMQTVGTPLPLIWRRYLKLVPPYLGALLLAIVCSALAGHLMEHTSTPEPATLPQFIAHIFLLHGILGFDGLSAGVWYVAIDFQLYTLLLLTLWLGHRAMPQYPGVGRALVGLLLIASLFYFNRNEAWDNWAFYFFGAYGLGALVYWSVRQHTVSPWLGLIMALVAVALVIDFRSRIAVALIVATSLSVARYHGFIESWPSSKILSWLGKISYAVFLAHFPICLVINALFDHYAPHTAEIQAVGMVIAWLASIGGGALFYYQIECRAQALLPGKRKISRSVR